MQLFDVLQARHFCTALPQSPTGTTQSLQDFHSSITTNRLREGTQFFTIHRVSMLNAVERWLLFGIAGYRRAVDMLIPCNAPWAHVTLYYSSFFAANAILGMFGGWVHIKRMVDVEAGVPGGQVLRISRNCKSPNGYPGSHQTFWDFFYEGCNAISPWAPTSLQSALTPVSADRLWQVRARNEVNYDTFKAFESALHFSATFKPARLNSLRGPLRQQLDLTEGLLRVAVYFANDFQVSSFPFAGLGTGTRANVMRALVTKTPPRLVDQSNLAKLLH